MTNKIYPKSKLTSLEIWGRLTPHYKQFLKDNNTSLTRFLNENLEIKMREQGIKV